MNAPWLAERLYEARRRHEGLTLGWIRLHPRMRYGYILMAESAINEMTKALLRRSLQAESGIGVARRRELIVRTVGAADVP